MNPPTIEHVLDLIGQMREEDRFLLEARLSERFEAEWGEIVARNRRMAQGQGITDETIQRAINRRRYGG